MAEAGKSLGNGAFRAPADKIADFESKNLRHLWENYTLKTEINGERKEEGEGGVFGVLIEER